MLTNCIGFCLKIKENQEETPLSNGHYSITLFDISLSMACAYA